MKTENKIIRAFLEENKEMTIREIAKGIRADYRITHIAVQRLINKKIIKVKSVGKSSFCSLNQSYYGLEIYQAEAERKDNLLKNKNINQLYKEVISKINTTLFIFLIFGSYAKGKATKASDIDLMFISNEKDFEDRIQEILSLLPLRTHISVFTEKEFQNMLFSRESNVVKEAVYNYIIIYGIENFYRLKHA